MDEVKPLPIPPVGNEITSLTVDAMAHISDVTRYSVKARSLPPAWEQPLDMAIKQFSKLLMTRADFLHDARTSRQNTLLMSAQDTASITGAPNELVIVNSASVATDVTQETLRSKQDPVKRLYDSLGTQKHGTRHLLVTVAAPPAAVTAQDLSYHIIPASHGCTFEPYAFHLPFFQDTDGTTRGDGGGVVCGLDSELPRGLRGGC